MANDVMISKEIQLIADKWGNPAARNGLFGNILKSVAVRNVRGMSTDIEFSWPITAIAGTNGSGKTTLLQLCSAAYVKHGGGRNYKIGEWVRGALAGETPAFDDTSSVTFNFWNDHPTVPIPYQRKRTRWGYPRRNNAERNVEFFGISTFAPRIERRDRLHVFRSQIEIKATAVFPKELLASISSVLGIPYPAGSMHTVGLQAGNWSDSLPQIQKNEHSYAEPHMGAGEQKVIRLIQALESLPKQSLILLEEPEITLHPDAQRGLAWYLMSVCRRKGHQIIIATHSSDLFETLPPEARVLLIRRKGGVDSIPRAPSISAARELAGIAKANKDLILVEDVVAKAFLKEILRQQDKKLFDNCAVIPVGNTDDVYRVVQNSRAEGIRAIGVRDPDVGEHIPGGIFSLPGDAAPEQLLLSQQNIDSAEKFLNGLGAAFERAKIYGGDVANSAWAKAVFPALAREMALSDEQLTDRLTLSWLNDNAQDVLELMHRINGALG